MDKNVKLKWLEALKSGEYQKGTGYLRDKEDKFCCLGVLCNLLKDESDYDWNTADVADKVYCFTPNNGMADSFNWWGVPLQIRQKIYFTKEHETELVSLNDNHPTWDEVIEYIEKEL